MVTAIRAAGGEVVAIGASTRARADAFAAELEISKAVEGYEAVVDDPDIDAIYLPLANGLHLEWALRIARAGKSCLCEKPLALTARDAAELRSAYEQAGCRLQEAFIWRHHPQMEYIAEVVESGEIGELRRVNSTYSFSYDNAESYRWSRAQGGGSLLDIGCYCVDACRYFFGSEPVAASARAELRPGEDGVDESAVCWIDFGSGRTASVWSSFRAAFFQGLELVGTDGRIWSGAPFSTIGRTTRVMVEVDGKRRLREFEVQDASRNMVRHFTRAVRDPSFALRPAEDGLEQSVIMEGLERSLRAGGAVWTRDPS